MRDNQTIAKHLQHKLNNSDTVVRHRPYQKLDPGLQVVSTLTYF